MKRLLPIFFLVLIFFLSGCSNTTTEQALEEDKDIVGTWECTVDTDQTKGSTKTTLTYTFNENGTYTLESVADVTDDSEEVTEKNTSSGRYTISENKLNLTVLKTNNDTTDEELQAIDDSITGEPSKESEESLSKESYDISLDGNKLILTLGDTEYDFSRVN